MQPIHVRPGSPLKVNFWRCCGSIKVWYEWCVTFPGPSLIFHKKRPLPRKVGPIRWRPSGGFDWRDKGVEAQLDGAPLCAVVTRDVAGAREAPSESFGWLSTCLHLWPWDQRTLEQLRRIPRLLTALKVVSALPQPMSDPTPLSLLPFGRLKFLKLRGRFVDFSWCFATIIHHNSTDALRHVLASRIVEIKGSPRWNCLSFVSCACNCLSLMDECLQLVQFMFGLKLELHL